MANTVTQIRCPNCNNLIEAEIQQVVDASRDPQSKARLLSGSLNRVRCPVCGYDGQLATPLVYHDADKQLLLTYMPMEVGLQKDEQERLIGRLINQIIEGLPAEKRKAYLLQPQSVLTPQGMAERILQADGITPEELEGRRAQLRLFEELIRTPEENLPDFVGEHDTDIDEAFVQLASLAIQTAASDEARQAASARLERALDFSSLGKRLRQQQDELRAAAESLQALGDNLTREKVLDLLIEAPSEERVVALVNLIRPAMDYSFFTLLSERIDSADGDEKVRLEALRARLLELTQEIDELQAARLSQSAGLLESILGSDDLDAALQEALPRIDEVFLAALDSNLRAAREQGDAARASKLEAVRRSLADLARRSLPPGMELAQRLLEADDEETAKEMLETEVEKIDEDLFQALIGSAERLDQEGRSEEAERARRLHRYAVRQSMRLKMREHAG